MTGIGMAAGPIKADLSLAADVAGVVLAAGAGERLRPLTLECPKALCPVGNVALVDAAVARVRGAVLAVAVNIHHGRAAMEAHFVKAGAEEIAEGEARRTAIHLSIEEPETLGTAGAIGFLREWVGERGVLVVNADTWCPAELGSFVADWDRERVRMLIQGPESFGPRSMVVASLLPIAEVSRLQPVPSGLYEVCWRAAAKEGRVETVGYKGLFIDCGTLTDYLRANEAARQAQVGTTDGSLIHRDATIDPRASVLRCVIGAGASVAGRVTDSVVWPTAVVRPGEELHHGIRTAKGRTILVR